MATEIGNISHRLERLEDALRGLEQRWDQRLDNLEERWDKRFSELTGRLDCVENCLDRMETLWDSRFAELRRNFFWLMGFQFTVSLAILALVVRGR